MGASDSILPVSASLEEERSETTEERSMRQIPLDPSQALDASYGPVYFEGKRPVALFRTFVFGGVVGGVYRLVEVVAARWSLRRPAWMRLRMV